MDKISKAAIAICIFFMMACISTSLHYGNRLLLGDPEKYDNDDVKYLRSAITLIEEGRLSYNYPDQPTVFIMPGIVLSLAPFVLAFGPIHAVTAFRIFSAILQSLTLFLLFSMARKSFGDKVSIVALILWVFYLPNIYVSTILLTETIFLFLFTCLLHLTIGAIETKRLSRYIAGGIVWGLCALFRPTIALFPIAILVMWIVKKYRFTEMLKFTLAASLAFVAVMSPWWIRNALVFERFIPFTLSSGNPKCQGAFIDYNQDVDYKENIDFSGIEYGNTEISIDLAENQVADRIIAYNIENNPLEYLHWYTLGKTWQNFKSPFVWFNLYGVSYKQMTVYHWSMLIVGVVGMITVFFRRRHTYAIFFVTIILYFNCVHLPFYCFSRYVYPAMPLIILFAAYGGWSIYEKISNNTSIQRTR